MGMEEPPDNRSTQFLVLCFLFLTFGKCMVHGKTEGLFLVAGADFKITFSVMQVRIKHLSSSYIELFAA